jgi:hypothetical protein
MLYELRAGASIKEIAQLYLGCDTVRSGPGFRGGSGSKNVGTRLGAQPVQSG